MYEVTVTSSNPAYGTVSGGGSYAENSVAMLTATANPGYIFDSWNDGSNDNPHYVTVTGNLSFVANFIEDTGVETFDALGAKIAVEGLRIIIDAPQGQPVRIVDVTGRILVDQPMADPAGYTMPAAGVYIVCVGNAYVRKVVVQ